MENEDFSSRQELNSSTEVSQVTALPPRKSFGQLSQGRSAIVSAVIIMLITDLFGLLSTFLVDNLETSAFLTSVQVVISTIIDVFLAINILRGKSWARTWMLIRFAIGIVLWGIVFVVQGDLASLIINTGILLALIILLTGTSTRFRLIGGIALAIVALIGGLVFSIFTYVTDLPSVSETLIIPEYFSTYASEGFFSISYPPDWSPEMSKIDEIEKEAKKYLNNISISSKVDQYQLVFIGGFFSGDDNFKYLSISVEPKNLLPVETLVESTHQWCVENVKDYSELSRVKTTIGGKSAVIQIYRGRDVDDYLTGFTSAIVVGDKFLWTVICLCDSEKLDSNLDTFDEVIRSLRVEY
jgi:hypothetical protein